MSIFGSGIRPWKRQTEAKRAADTTVPGKGELVVSDAGKVYVPDGTTQAKNLSPLVSKIVADATYALLWQPNTAYAANAPVMLPNGKTATRTSAGTSRPSFDATELAAWTIASGGSGSSAWADITGKPAVIGAGADAASARATIEAASLWAGRTPASTPMPTRRTAFAGKPNGAPASTDDTGQSVIASGGNTSGAPIISGGKFTTQIAGTGQKYAYREFQEAQPVTRVGCRFTFDSQSGARTGKDSSVVCAISAGKIADYATIGVHLVIKQDRWSLTSLSFSPYSYDTIFEDFFETPLVADGATVYEVEVFREGRLLVVRLPDGSIISYSSPLFASRSGVWGFHETTFEHVESEIIPAITECWADSRKVMADVSLPSTSALLKGNGAGGAAAATAGTDFVAPTSTANRLYGTDNAGAQSLLAISASPDSWTVGYRDGSGRMKVNTPSDVYDATPKAYVDGKVRTGVFQFEHSGALLTAGSALTYQIRRPFRIPHTATSSGFRVHLRNRDHLNDLDGGALTAVAMYIGEAALDATGEPNGNFAATPVQVQASTSVAAGAELISGWIAPGTFTLSPYKHYLLAYTFTVANGVKYSAGGGRFWYTTTASDVSVQSPSSNTRVDNQGFLDLYVEYKFADRNAPVMMVVSNSIDGGGNTGGVANRAELGCWHTLWALREAGVAASLAVGGAWCGHFTASSPKWNAYSTLDVALEVDAVILFAITSSDIAAGTALADVRTELQVTMAKVKALWPNARIIVTTNSARADSTGTPETNRVSFNRELAACPYGAHQSIDIATPLSDRATPERNLVQFQGAPAGLGSSTDGVHWSEAAHATAAGLIPVRYGAVVPHI